MNTNKDKLKKFASSSLSFLHNATLPLLETAGVERCAWALSQIETRQAAYGYFASQIELKPFSERVKLRLRNGLKQFSELPQLGQLPSTAYCFRIIAMPIYTFSSISTR